MNPLQHFLKKWSQCEHYNECPVASPKNKFCCSGGGWYCGKWRELEGRS